jgi:hypothetical protein
MDVQLTVSLSDRSTTVVDDTGRTETYHPADLLDGAQRAAAWYRMLGWGVTVVVRP